MAAEKIPSIIAHRGNSAEAPENTIAAFRKAVEAGAGGVEFDVHASRDGVPVVIHDERLERTTDGAGVVGAYTAAQLGALEAGLWFDPPHPGEGVPTLAAVLEMLAPTSLEIHIELKTAHSGDPELVRKVIARVEAAGLSGRTVLSSFDHPLLLQAAGSSPRLPCAALLGGRLIEPWRYAAGHGFEALHLDYRTIDEALVRQSRQAGLAVRAYTVDDPEAVARLLAWGVAGVITNRPREMLALPGRSTG